MSASQPPTHRLTSEVIRNEAELRAVIGVPQPQAGLKIVDRLNDQTRRFVERSPFVCLATADAALHCDVSPRGDPPGFVRILDERTLLIPERPGNRLADALRNILANPHIGLLFIVPGIDDTLRVNGRATLTTDAALLAPCAVEGQVPRLGILVDIDEAYTQCPRAFLRGRVWDPASFAEPAELPTAGEVLRAIRGTDFDADAHDRDRAERLRQRLGFY